MTDTWFTVRAEPGQLDELDTPIPELADEVLAPYAEVAAIEFARTLDDELTLSRPARRARFPLRIEVEGHGRFVIRRRYAYDAEPRPERTG